MAIEANDNAPTEPARVKKNKPKRGLGSAVTRKRRLQAEALEEGIKARTDRERQAARQELERLKNRTKVEAKQADNFGPNLLRTVISNQTNLFRVWGFNQAVNSKVHTADHVVAYTDFKSITVNWPQSKLPHRLNRTEVLDTIAQIKGVMQHEMGHVRFTTSWATVTGEYPPDYTKRPKHLLHKCWNMLEDMRMESLVVQAVPRIKNYFGTMVANVVLNGGNLPMEQAWLMLAGREYLPKPVLKQSYMLFDQWTFDQGINDGALTWFNLVQDYKAADTNVGIVLAVEAAYDFIQKVRATMPESMDDMDNMDNAENDAQPGDTAKPQGSILDLFNEKPPKPSKCKSGEKGSGNGEESEPSEGGDAEEYEDPNESSDDSGQSKGSKKSDKSKGDTGEESDDEAEGEGGGGDGEDNESKPKQTKPNQSNHGNDSETEVSEGDLNESLNDMLNEMQNTIRNDGDIQDMARQANSKTDTKGLPAYDNETTAMSPELTERALFTALGIERALTSFVTQAAPIWQTRKDIGIIDALAYRTKNVGDRDFRRHLDSHGNIGLDVHVSMLCDVSGSMGGNYGQGGDNVAPIVALSESLYGMATACRNLGIGATYTLWSSDSQNYRVWADGQPTPVLWPCMGGTDPTKALDDLDTHNPEAAEKHLVVIFTDGAWAHNFPNIQRWTAPGRTFVLVRYGAYEGAMQKDMGADKHIGISSVRQLPEELTKALVEVLAEGGGW